MPGVTTYTKKTLIAGERILYSARGHIFNLLFPIMLVVLGVIIATLPIIIEKAIEISKKPEVQQYFGGKEKTKEQLDKEEAEKGAIMIFVDDAIYYVEGYIAQLPPEALAIFQSANIIRFVFVGGILIFVGLLIFITGVIRKISTEHVVTSKKIILKKGFIKVDEVEIPLKNVEGVKVIQTAFDRMINRGNILVNGIGMEQIEIRKIHDPNKFRNYAYLAIDKFVK